MIKKILFLVLVLCVFSKAALASLSISADYPKEILIEKGWVNYFSVIVTNNGDNLHDVTISFDGEYTQWLEIETNKTDLLQSGSNASFMVKLSVPSSAVSRVNSFVLNIKSKEISDSKTLTVRVFNSESDVLLYQVQQLESEIEDVKRNATRVKVSGKNVTGVESTLDEAQSYLNDSKIYIDREEYEKVTPLMINAEDSIKKATYDLTIVPLNNLNSSNTLPFELLFVPVLVVLFVVVFYLGFKRKKPASQPAAAIQPVTKTKEVIPEGRDANKLEDELKEFENSINLLEEEFKENLLSKETYDELKAKYEKRISDLREEVERNRRV